MDEHWRIQKFVNGEETIGSPTKFFLDQIWKD